MSGLPYAASHDLEPPIASSSVPRCPCQRSQPCPCESYARRLELRQRHDQELMMGVAETLRALAGVAEGTLRKSLLNAADALF